MNCAVFPVAYSGGRACGLTHDLAGAGQPAQAPELHADGRTFAYNVHTVGGVDVRLLCPLTYLLGRVVGVLFPAARFLDGGQLMNGQRFNSRADDEILLARLHALATQSNADVRKQFGITNSAIQSMKSRFRTEAERAVCACEKPKNKDGGMPQLWWQT